MPHSAGLEGDDGPAPEKGVGEGDVPSSPLANADDAGSSTPPPNDGKTAPGAGDETSADDAGTLADTGTTDAEVQCNALARQPNDAPYYVRFGVLPDLGAYSGGVIQDGTYVLTEDRRYLGQPRTPDGGDWTGTSWATLNVKGNHLSAVVTDHEGGEVRFNALIVLDGSRVYLTLLCGLEQPAETSEWRELKFPFINSGYSATNDTLSIAWMIGNHGAVAKVFHRVQEPQPTL